MPPRLAPVQVVIVPIYKNDVERIMVMEVVEKIKGELSMFRIKIDDRNEVTPGFKFNDWEMRGVPLRIEVGPKDVEKGSLALSRRDHPGRAGKAYVPQSGIAFTVKDILEDIHKSMLAHATEFRDSNIHDPHDYAELKEVLSNGWAYSWWCESAECETRVKEDTKASTRCIPIDQPSGSGTCIVCGKKANKKVYFSRSY
jgi:prolyl-tRNA synthetase